MRARDSVGYFSMIQRFKLGRIYMREHPDFQFGSAEFPMPEIVVGRYAPLARPTLDSLRMKATEHGSSGCAIEKGLNGLKWVRGLRRTPNQIDRDVLTVFHRGNLEGCPDQSAYSTLS